jgi:hypothetical protein
MRYLFIILLLPFVSYGQTYTVDVTPGEYTTPSRGNDSLIICFSDNTALVGISGATSGIPKEITGTGTKFVGINNTLHGGVGIDVNGFPWTFGNNTDGELGTGLGTILTTFNITKLTLDSRGVSLSPITIVQGSYIQNGSNDVAGLFYVKHGSLSDTIEYSGWKKYGIGGDGDVGSDTASVPTMMFGLPSGKRVVQMCAGSAVALLLNDGTVETWGAAGTVSYLGRPVSGNNYATPIQVTIPGSDSIVQIVGGADPGILYLGKSGHLYGNSNYNGYMGNSSNGTYTSPTDLNTNITSHILNGTTRTSILMIGAIMSGFYVIANDHTLWFFGDTGMGAAGVGNEANMLTPGGTSTPWFIDPTQHLVVPVYTPVQVTNKTNWVKVFSGVLFALAAYAEDSNNQLWSWSRNKGGPIPNKVKECTGDGGALTDSLPNSWDVTDATPVNPYSIVSTIDQGNLGCASGLITAGCFFNCRTVRTPTAVATSTNGVLNATGSSTPSPNSIVRYRWSQISGPNTALIPARASPIDTLGNLIPGTYTFGLQVMDNGYDSATTTVNLVVGQTGFYVSSSTGSDGNGGTIGSPYATIAKAISSVVSGDTIYLKSGDTFTGTVYPITGIVFEPYSTGAAPIVSGLTTLTGWTNEGGGIYGKLCTGCKVSTNLVITDGVVDHMARWPNTGYRTFTAINSTSFTDATLPNSPSYIGSTAVLKDERYIIDTVHVTGQSSGVVSIASAPGSTNLNGHGYFFENLFSLLDTLNEFYINPTTDSIYTFSADPITNHTIQVSTSDTGFYFNHVNNVTINGVKITGYNQYNIFTNTDTALMISNCSIPYGGNDGVHSNQCVKCSYISDTIQFSNNNGVTATGSNTNHKVYQSCQVSQNGLLPGMGHSGGGGTYEGINDPFGFATFLLNNVHHNGSSGLTVGGDSLNVFNNHCHHDGQIKSDGAEIYTHDGSAISYTYHRNINANICDHAFNDSAGVNYILSDVNFGIYLDAAASGLFVFNNTSDSNSSAGIFNHGSNNSITGNNLFGNYYFQSVISEVSPFTITGITYTNNTHGFIGSTANSIALTSTGNDLSSFGTIDNNYYLCPIGLLSTLFTKSSVDGGTSRTLASWTSNTTYDAHSLYLNSPLLFQSSVLGGTFSLPGTYKSATGVLFRGSLTLAPYSSQTLMPFSLGISSPIGNRKIVL